METLKIPLSNNFFAVIGKNYSLKNKTIPQTMKGDKVIYSIAEEVHISYTFHSIETSAGVIVGYEYILHEFIELLHSFVGNQLTTNMIYTITDKQGIGFKASIKSENHSINLKIDVSNESYYLDKFQCRVISSKLSKIYSKCEFNFYQ